MNEKRSRRTFCEKDGGRDAIHLKVIEDGLENSLIHTRQFVVVEQNLSSVNISSCKNKKKMLIYCIQLV
jgi:hypothetical protein